MMTPESNSIWSLGEDRIKVLGYETDDSGKTEIRFIYLNEIETLDIKSFHAIATPL